MSDPNLERRMPDLNNSVALVTGASSGIGRSIAQGLAERGTTVCLVGRDPQRLANAESNARIQAPDSAAWATDLTRDDQVQQLIDNIERRFGRLDVLVHAAGIYSAGPLESSTLAEFDRLYRTNVRAPFALTQGALPMLRQSAGQVVFINSLAVAKPNAGISQYCATKHALKAIADSLREEVNAAGIRVVSVYPGRTASLLQETIHSAEGRPYHPSRLLQPEDVASVVIQSLFLPRSAEVTDLYVRPMLKS